MPLTDYQTGLVQGFMIGILWANFIQVGYIIWTHYRARKCK